MRSINKMKKIIATTVIFLIITLSTINLFASTETTGDIKKVDPPASVVEGATESDVEIKAFNEKQDFILPTDIRVDIISPGHFDGIETLTPGTITAGTVVNSHFLHFDPVGTETQTITLSGSISSDSEILGIIILGEALNNTDVILGLPGIAYPTSSDRVLELGHDEDMVTLDTNKRGLTVQFVASTDTDIDQIRVITAIPEAPTEQISDLKIREAEIEFGEKSGTDKFEIKGGFRLKEDSDGIDPENEEVTVTVGTSTLTIPAGSFVEKEGDVTMAVGPSFFKRFHASLGKGDDDDDDDSDDDKGNGKGKDDDDSDDDDSEEDEEDDGNEGGEVEMEGEFEFEGNVNGVDLKMEIKETDMGDFKFEVKAKDADLAGTTNPMDILLMIGNDTWKAAGIRFEGELKFKGEEEEEEEGEEEEEEEDMEGQDSDSDGVADDEDKCPDSNPDKTVIIDECDTGVANDMVDDGCNISDGIAECAERAKNHGAFVSCVAKLSNKLKKNGIITGKEAGAIQKCAAQADIP